jgi:hypothetical protein
MPTLGTGIVYHNVRRIEEGRGRAATLTGMLPPHRLPQQNAALISTTDRHSLTKKAVASIAYVKEFVKGVKSSFKA